MKKILLIFFCAIILIMTVRGNYGNPSIKNLNTPYWRENGPFELSPERGRYALTHALIETGSVFFPTDLARFVVPDLGYKNGKYVSLFAPGVSYLIVPGYIVGRFLGISQVGSFYIISLFALLNLILIYKIARFLGVGNFSSWLSGLVFLFATPAFAYSVDLYQHHISTFLILLSAFIVMSAKKTWPLFIVFFLCAMSIPVDYPNLIIMFPIGIIAIQKLIFNDLRRKVLALDLQLGNALLLTGVVLPLLFFMWFNQKSYGNSLQFSGTVERVKAISIDGKPLNSELVDAQSLFEQKLEIPNNQINKRSALEFFNPRRILNGFYIHILSPDRGMIFFAPVLFLGIIGIILLYQKKNIYLPMFLGIIISDLVLYSMWGDPWGGWAFGSRYLIPSYAILSVTLGIALTKYKKNILFAAIFLVLMVYSIVVNTSGAITSSANPPQIEIENLESLSGKSERYSWDRNWEILKSGNSKSFVFRSWAKNHVSAFEYFYILAGSITFFSVLLYILQLRDKNNE